MGLTLRVKQWRFDPVHASNGNGARLINLLLMKSPKKFAEELKARLEELDKARIIGQKTGLIPVK